ncbi:MAG TPA: PAS domain S-box protein [Terriglobia bacterium]|jgi:PAS domain S-box-containing protein
MSQAFDLTDRRQAQAAKRLLASVVESSADGIISEDLNGIVTSWNRGAERMFGYSAEEIIGRTISIIVPSGTGSEIPGVLEAIKRGEAIEQYETVRMAKNGKLINVSITWSPLYDSEGRVAGASKVVRDISERKQMEEQRMELIAKERALAMERALRETEAELARVARALSVGELTTSIAHEINQPLAGVVTNAEAGLRWLSRETPNIEKAKASLALIVRDGNRASAVIRGIRELLTKERPQTTSLDINEVIREVLALAHAELTKRGITPYSELAPDLPPVLSDRVQLQQVILNLIMNSADAMASIDRPKELFITSQKPIDSGVLVTVRDSGIGIHPQDVDLIFEPFFTTKPAGIGMGLALSRSIVESHGGRIWPQLNEGPGLTVQFSLPAAAAEQKFAAASKL